MKKAYSGGDPADAHLVRGLLEANGIKAVVQGEALWAARGELPLTPETAPSVWVFDEDYQRARRLIAEHEKRPNASHCANCGHDLRDLPEPRCPECGQTFFRPEWWICPDCGEAIEGQFTECWRCAGTGE